jgi:hypothetical protein
MGLIDLPEVCDYFPDDINVCPIVRQLPFDNTKKTGQYLHLSNNKDRPRQEDEDYSYLYIVQLALNILNTSDSFINHVAT